MFKILDSITHFIGFNPCKHQWIEGFLFKTKGVVFDEEKRSVPFVFYKMICHLTFTLSSSLSAVGRALAPKLQKVWCLNHVCGRPKSLKRDYGSTDKRFATGACEILVKVL